MEFKMYPLDYADTHKARTSICCCPNCRGRKWLGIEGFEKLEGGFKFYETIHDIIITINPKFDVLVIDDVFSEYDPCNLHPLTDICIACGTIITMQEFKRDK